MRTRWLASLAALAGCAPTTASAPVPCAVGERPDYFVPGGPSALLGCARLGVSGLRVDFSANFAEIDGERHVCINPAYGDGAFIPAICPLDLSGFAVHDAGQPRQGVRGYGYVIWGSTGGSTEVVARFDGGTARAAVFATSPKLFVIELPLAAARSAVTVTGDRAGDVEQVS